LQGQIAMFDNLAIALQHEHGLLPLFLTGFSGLCWTIVYIDCIRLGIQQKTYAMPFWALALNIAWEGVYSVIGIQYMMQAQVLALQPIINLIWFVLDIGIVYTYFRFGKKYFPAIFPSHWFYAWSILGFIVAFVIQILFFAELGFMGARYSAFLQNLLMSVLFINMLVQRKSSEGQSMLIAVGKWLGTLAPTILFGLLGTGDVKPSSLILALGIFCSIFDLIYIWLLAKVRAIEKQMREENPKIREGD